MDTTINIDAGGTFTDGFFTRNDTTETAKVPTTAHDLTVCFIDCIERGAEKLGMGAPTLLSEADFVRFSTTVGTNTVIEKSGPKLGVLVTAGHETDLYSDGKERITDGFVTQELVEGVSERVAPDGTIEEPIDPDDVTRAVKRLQERGARHIVVGLEHAYANPANEQRVKDVIEDQYPRHYLGALPTTATFEVTARPNDWRRLNTAVINAYIHRPMKSALYRAEDKIRDAGHGKPLFIGHSNGGVARVAKSIAINTHNSGPAAGVLGVRELSRLYDQDMIAADMGGTSIDISVIRDGAYTVELTPRIDTLETTIPAIQTYNLGAGGGSIATVDDDLTVGPESAGANPGPACFGRGGTQATVTDADLVRGIINPSYFLGGRYSLDADRGEKALTEHVAEPLGVDPATAADAVAKRVQQTIADGIAGVSTEIDTIVAFGGAGGVHAAGFASMLGVERVLVTPYSSVFSAFGESMMDVTHTYAEYVGSPDPAEATEILDSLLNEAHRDLRAEGFAASEVDVVADALESDGDSYRIVPLVYDSDAGVQSLPSSETHACIRLHASGRAPKTTFAAFELQDEDPSAALKGERPVNWGNAYRETPIYDHADLQPNNLVPGPAVIEAIDTTIAVPPDWTYRIDRYGHGVLE